MMIRISRLRYYIGEALKSIARNSFMSLSSIVTVASCIFIVVFSYCIAINIDFFLEQLEGSIGISAHIDNALSDEEVNELRKEIENIEHIVYVEYISSQKALQDFAQALDTSQDILSALEGDNPLRRSFTLSIDDIKNQGKVIDRLKSEEMQNKGIVNVRDAKDVIDILIAINNVIRVVSIIIILMLGMLSVIIIINTIKITVNNRRNEIGIMKYVGATNWFIKWPFVLEGIFIGVLGSLLPVGAGIFGYDKVIELIIDNFPLINSIMVFKESSDIFPVIAPFLVSMGAGIGIIGSLTSLRKHLDV